MLKQFLLPFILLFGTANFVFAQSNFSNEIGIISGPVSFQSDYGERGNFSPYIGNTGFGIGFIHYVNLSYIGYNQYKNETYFNEHFKLRTEISYTKSKFQHYGSFIDKGNNTIGSQQLRAMRGETEIINTGLQLEYYLANIRDFENTTGSLNPYISFGAHYSFYKPKAYSLLGPLETNSISKFIGATTNSKSGVMSIVASVGTRYKLNELSDLIIETKMQYYFSDWVDGLNPDSSKYPENKANDWLVWLNVGYIYYLNQ
jgi:hypothetical protein